MAGGGDKVGFVRALASSEARNEMAQKHNRKIYYENKVKRHGVGVGDLDHHALVIEPTDLGLV